MQVSCSKSSTDKLARLAQGTVHRLNRQHSWSTLKWQPMKASQLGVEASGHTPAWGGLIESRETGLSSCHSCVLCPFLLNWTLRSAGAKYGRSSTSFSSVSYTFLSKTFCFINYTSKTANTVIDQLNISMFLPAFSLSSL